MKKVGITIFLAGIMMFSHAAEKLFLLAEDGFSDFLKQDFHRFAIRMSQKYDCKLSAIPESGVKPVLKIGTTPGSGEYETVLFAVRGSLFFANQENPVKGLSSVEVRQILDGSFRRWSRTRVAVKQICYSGSEKIVPRQLKEESVPWVRFPQSGLALQMVADDITALGILPLTDAGLSYSSKIKLLPVDGVMPTPQTVMEGKYPACQRYYLSIRKDAPAEIRAIYETLRSKQTKLKLLQAGILPAVEGVWKK